MAVGIHNELNGLTQQNSGIGNESAAYNAAIQGSGMPNNFVSMILNSQKESQKWIDYKKEQWTTGPTMEALVRYVDVKRQTDASFAAKYEGVDAREIFKGPLGVAGFLTSAGLGSAMMGGDIASFQHGLLQATAGGFTRADGRQGSLFDKDYRSQLEDAAISIHGKTSKKLMGLDYDQTDIATLIESKGLVDLQEGALDEWTDSIVDDVKMLTKNRKKLRGVFGDITSAQAQGLSKLFTGAQIHEAAAGEGLSEQLALAITGKISASELLTEHGRTIKTLGMLGVNEDASREISKRAMVAAASAVGESGVMDMGRGRSLSYSEVYNQNVQQEALVMKDMNSGGGLITANWWAKHGNLDTETQKKVDAAIRNNPNGGRQLGSDMHAATGFDLQTLSAMGGGVDSMSQAEGMGGINARATRVLEQEVLDKFWNNSATTRLLGMTSKTGSDEDFAAGIRNLIKSSTSATEGQAFFGAVKDGTLSSSMTDEQLQTFLEEKGGFTDVASMRKALGFVETQGAGTVESTIATIQNMFSESQGGSMASFLESLNSAKVEMDAAKAKERADKAGEDTAKSDLGSGAAGVIDKASKNMAKDALAEKDAAATKEDKSTGWEIKVDGWIASLDKIFKDAAGIFGIKIAPVPANSSGQTPLKNDNETPEKEVKTDGQ